MFRQAKGFTKGVFERWWMIFGHQIHLRIEPPEFRADIRKLSRMIDLAKTREQRLEAAEFVEKLYSKWGSDPEIIRLDYARNWLHDTEDS